MTELLPLSGQRIIVTRAPEQAAELSNMLRERGATPIEVPTIRTVDPSDGGAALRDAVTGLGSFEWLIVTSPNGARRFRDALRDVGQRAMVKVAAIGPGTARVLADGHIGVDLVPDEYVAEGLLRVFPVAPNEGGRVLLAVAEEARPTLPDGLSEAGWTVEVVPSYRTVPAELDRASEDELEAADIVTFTSSSTVRRFVDLVGIENVPPAVACIGPITAATARELGLSVAVEASNHTIAGLLEALETWARATP